MFDDPPSGRFCGEGAMFRRIPHDWVEFSEISTYLDRGGEGVRNSRLAILRSTALRCLRGMLKKDPMFADPPPGRFCGDGAGFRGIPPDRPQFNECANFWGCKGGIARPMMMRAIV